MNNPLKISIVGTGMVGTTFAYRLLTSGIASSIALIDVNLNKAEGESEDLQHAMVEEYATNIHFGDLSLARYSDIVVITAGLAQKPGETRLDLVSKNLAIFKDMIPKLADYAPNALYLIASNPLDVLTYATIKYSNLDPKQIIGSGTVLDSNRFRFFLSEALGVAPQDVNGYVLGEHGDSAVPVFSSATVAGIPIEEFVEQTDRVLSNTDKEAITERTKNAVYQLISKKGATYYGIGSALFHIVSSIANGSPVVLPVSTLLTGQYGISDVCMALPTIIGARGVQGALAPLLSAEELASLHESAVLLKGYGENI